MIQLQGPSFMMTNDECLKVCRDTGVIIVDGKPVKRPPENFNITCTVQPLNDKDLMLVPEGDRFKEQYWVWMNLCEKPLLLQDIVLRAGLDNKTHCPITVRYEVQGTQDWGDFIQSRIMRQDVGPGATP